MMENVSSRRAGPRLLIADDHAMFAETLRAYVEKTYTVVGAVLDGQRYGGRSHATPAGRDCCGRRYASLEWVRCGPENQSRSSRHQVRLSDDANLAAAALELGRIGFVSKHSTGQELLTAIDHVLLARPI
jgi:DNA-binding NarL/FixJ family response regulator